MRTTASIASSSSAERWSEDDVPLAADGIDPVVDSTALPRSRLETARALAWSLLLLAAVWAVYWEVRSFEFVHYDDLDYLFKETYVRRGLTWPGIVWAFTETQIANWHPLTMLSYLLDVELWGMEPGAFHLVNVALHAANGVLLFLLLRRTTGHEARSAVVALLFALHPLHVESVAWVAARKDVLSTLFLILTIWTYARWVERPTRWRYAGVLLVYVLGLMSKPMLVTLPFLLLLLDYWPLGRFAAPGRPGLGRLVLEKLPLLGLAAASSVITLVVQQGSGAMQALEHLTLLERAANAAQSYLRYLGMMVWPSELGVLYPMPAQVDLTLGALACVTLLVVSTAVWFSARRMPYLFTGWFWYVGTLVPVIGIVQVGVQSHADRYTYVPLIGIFIAIVWAADAVLGKRRSARIAVMTAAYSVLVALGIRAWFQVGIWRDSETLYEHALAVAPENPHIHFNLAALLSEHGRPAEAVTHYQQTVRQAPDLWEAWCRLALALASQGDLAGGRQVLEELRLRTPDSSELQGDRSPQTVAQKCQRRLPRLQPGSRVRDRAKRAR